MLYSHQVKYLRISPKKLQQVAKLVKGQKTAQAINILLVQKQKGASMLAKAIEAAQNNASQVNIDLTKFKLVGIACSKGPVFMRRWIRLRGTAAPKRKYTTHARLDFVDTAKKDTVIKKEKTSKTAKK